MKAYLPLCSEANVKIFSYLFSLFEKLSYHRFATPIMCLNAFIESIFWPVPADVMLVPMCVYQRRKSLYYALLTVISSVLGAIIGYYLGFYLYDPYIHDFIKFMHYQKSMALATSYLVEYGVMFVFVGAFTPIPYKVIAITAGLCAAQSIADSGSAGNLSIIPFVLVSFVGRGLRFFLEAVVILIGGEKMEHVIRKYIDRIGWACVILIVIFVAYKSLI